MVVYYSTVRGQAMAGRVDARMIRIGRVYRAAVLSAKANMFAAKRRLLNATERWWLS